uniref:CUB domain-containing protein n=1 Tax=Heterorhabditis bacteriophora TaxID=37862 RepID=A0A1I7XFW7_HETBA
MFLIIKYKRENKIIQITYIQVRMERMRTLERVVETRIDLLEWEKSEPKEDCAACRALDCDIIFALLFTMVIACLLVLIMVFWLKGVLQYEDCEIEYVDIYSELESVEADLLTASLGGRYCGTVAPHIRISLYRVLVLVFHSRARETDRKFGFRGKYTFIPETKYQPGTPVSSGHKCSFIIDPGKRKRGAIYSPTYPGTYPKNFHCSYLLRGKSGQRIRLMFRDFDVYFAGEQFVIEYEFSSRFVDISQLLNGQRGVTHMRGTECDVRVESNRETTHYIHSPKYPEMYPANTTCSYILDGLQGDQNLEKVILTFDSFAVLSDSADRRVISLNTAFTYLFFTSNESVKNALKEIACIVSITSADPSSVDEVTCPSAWVGVATSDANMKAALSSTDESNFEATLCDRIAPDSPLMGPYVSEGPRMVVQFGTTDKIITDELVPFGFKAKVEFKTGQEKHFLLIHSDFGVAGEPMGTSNECRFRFRSPMGFFNSPRYPANYPLDTNCTYFIEGKPGQQILIHFEQFALFGEREEDRLSLFISSLQKIDRDYKSFHMIISYSVNIDMYVYRKITSWNTTCKDWLEIYDVFQSEDGEKLVLQGLSTVSSVYLIKCKIVHKERYCSETFPGPTVSAFGAYAMRVVFCSDSAGSGNGFKALYEIRPAIKEDIPSHDLKDNRSDGPYRCGRRIMANEFIPTGYVMSPNYPIKYNKDVHCDWEIVARKGYRILLTMVKMEVEGEMSETTAMCQKIDSKELIIKQYYCLLPVEYSLLSTITINILHLYRLYYLIVGNRPSTTPLSSFYTSLIRTVDPLIMLLYQLVVGH